METCDHIGFYSLLPPCRQPIPADSARILQTAVDSCGTLRAPMLLRSFNTSVHYLDGTQTAIEPAA